MVKTRTITAKGVVELDLHRCMVDFLHKNMLAFGKHRGAKLEDITLNFNRTYLTYKTDKQILAILQGLEKLKIAKAREYKDCIVCWSLVGKEPKNWRLPFDYDPKTADSANRHKRFVCKVSYTKKGQAKITIPKPVIDKLAKPETVEFYIEQDRAILRQLT